MFIRFCLIFCFALQGFSVFAQLELFTDTTVFAASAGRNKVAIVLGFHLAHPETTHPLGIIGYHVYRKGVNETDFKKLTVNPISAPLNPKTFIDIVGESMFNRLMEDRGYATPDSLFKHLKAGDKSLAVAAVLFHRKVAEAIGAIWYDENVKEGETYTYYITKIDKNKLESAPSHYLEVKVGIPQKPLDKAVISSVNVFDRFLPSSEDSTIIIGQKAVDLNFTPDKNQMVRNIYRGTDPTGLFFKINDLPIFSPKAENTELLTYQDTTVRLGTTYFYTISTSDIWGYEVFSDTIRVPVMPLEPTVPQGLSTESLLEGVRISWKPAENPHLLGYQLYRRTDDQTDFSMTLVNEQLISPKDTIFIDKKVRANEVYVYRLQAVDKFQQVSPPSALSKVIYLNKNKPLPPKQLKVENAERFIKISWERSSHRDVSGYVLLRSAGINQEPAVITPIIGKDTLYWVDSLQLKPRVTYAYYLKELNWSGMESRLSAPVFGKLTVKIPPSPMNSLTGEAKFSSGNQLFWRQPMDAYTSIVRLYRATYPDTTNFTKIYEEMVSIGKYQFEDKQTEIGKLYRYVIRPVSVDSVEGVNSSPVDLIRIPPPLQAPQQLSISEIGNSLRIKWTPVIKPNVAGYLIYRWEYNSGEKKLTPQLLPKNTTQFVDTDIQAGETYYYWVKAIDDKGYEGLPSEKIKYEILK
ncbi:MAG: hypothetical protein OHK0038_08840 [Flammeovirgaceae bacterium]